jgi:hypothetical protein
MDAVVARAMLSRTAAVPLLALFLVGLPSCAAWHEARQKNEMKSFRANVLPKASFALSCPVDQLQVQLMPVEFAEDALVSGCGKKATFHLMTSGWVMESASSP